MFNNKLKISKRYEDYIIVSLCFFGLVYYALSMVKMYNEFLIASILVNLFKIKENINPHTNPKIDAIKNSLYILTIDKA